MNCVRAEAATGFIRSSAAISALQSSGTLWLECFFSKKEDTFSIAATIKEKPNSLVNNVVERSLPCLQNAVFWKSKKDITEQSRDDSCPIWISSVQTSMHFCYQLLTNYHINITTQLFRFLLLPHPHHHLFLSANHL